MKMAVSRYSPLVVRITIAILSLHSGAANANDTSASWIKDGKSIDGTAQIYLSPAFATAKGKYAAVPESVIDSRSSIEGEFLVGTYRYVFKTPETSTGGIRSDELVSTEILDCKENFFGTAKQVRKFKGKIVNQSITAPGDILMTQSTGPEIGSKLCALAQHNKVTSPEHRAGINPSYNPRPTAKDLNRIVDKYAPAAK